MSTPSIAKSRNLKTAASKKRSVQSSATARRKVTSAATTAKVPPKSDEPKVERVTKQERLLTLLSQADGASIEERNLPVSGRARVRVMVRKLPLFGELGTRRRFSKQYYAARQKSLLDAGVIWSGRWASIVLMLPKH